MTKDNEILIPIEGNAHLAISACYRLGGMNYFSGAVDTRGIYVRMYPVEIKTDTDGVVWRTSKIHLCNNDLQKSGCTVLLKELKRGNKKMLGRAFECVSHYADDLFKHWNANDHSGLQFVINQVKARMDAPVLKPARPFVVKSSPTAIHI